MRCLPFFCWKTLKGRFSKAKMITPGRYQPVGSSFISLNFWSSWLLKYRGTCNVSRLAQSPLKLTVRSRRGSAFLHMCLARRCWKPHPCLHYLERLCLYLCCRYIYTVDIQSEGRRISFWMSKSHLTQARLFIECFPGDITGGMNLQQSGSCWSQWLRLLPASTVG